MLATFSLKNNSKSAPLAPVYANAVRRENLARKKELERASCDSFPAKSNLSET
jgi:hypothetical protein